MTRRVADGTIDVAAGQPGQIAVPVTWGRYRLEVTSPDPQGPETTIGFEFRLVREILGRHAGPARDRARQAGI